MKQQMTSEHSSTIRFWGLNEKVKYRIELGFVFADDGIRVYKFSSALFEALLAQGESFGPEEKQKYIEILTLHPSVFCCHMNINDALQSIVSREI